MKSNNIIEINGKKFDAKSGALLDGKKTVQKKITVDGISAVPTSTPEKPKQSANATRHPKNRATGHAVKRHLHHSTTLNRHAVKHPMTSQASTSKKPSVVVETSPALKPKVDKSRLERAGTVTKSSAIKKFNSYAPEHAAVSTKSDTHDEAVDKVVALPEATPAPVHTAINSHQKLTHHLAKAQQHEVHAKHHGYDAHHSRSKLFSYGASGLVVLLLAGYVAYLNIPSLSMKVAASRAGFAATMPANSPSGYSLHGPVMASPGQVSINFASNTDQRKFSIKQQPTVWDSAALLENYVALKDKSYRTYQDSGLTIYIYGNGNAAWVSDSKFYDLTAPNAELDTKQILDIATSM